MSALLDATDPPLSSLLEQRLRALGYPLPDPAPPAEITQALTALQRDQGLPLTGEADPETWAALLSVAPRPDGLISFSVEPPLEPAEPTDLAPGASGALLDELQLRLRALGLETGFEEAFGALTQAALAAFQERVLLNPDGRPDEDTLVALRGATRAVGPLFCFAPEEALRDQGGPLVFGQDSRDVEGTGGYAYRQFDDGAVQILRSPQGGVSARVLRQGAAWRAITAEIGPFPLRASPAERLGSAGEPALALQRRLNALGFGPLSEDGRIGPATRAALRRFQAAARLDATGDVDAATEARLQDPWPPLQPGDRGAEVRLCQERLRALGLAITALDGDYGPELSAAVSAFQADQKLPVTGIIDATTRGHILGAQAVGVPDPTLEAERARLTALFTEGAALLPAEARPRVLAVLQEAVRWFGLREIPKGSNGGPEIGPITADFVRPGEALPPWCALAVSHWLKQGLGAASWADTPLGFRNASALAFGRWGEKHARLLPPEGPAPAGSIFVMYRDGSGSDAAGQRGSGAAKWDGTGHTGLVLADLGDRVLSLDGNVSDRCWTATRPKSRLLGYVGWW